MLLAIIEDSSGMRPKLGDTHITLPITFDYSGGRGDRWKSIKLWAVILSIVGLIVAIGILTSDRVFYIKIPVALVILYGVLFIIRFLMLRETDKKEEYKKLVSTDYVLDYKEIWGIYKVEDIHPYICRFRNGKSGIYIRLNKDIILGKYADSEYNHYEAISDAYNLAGAGKVQMVHVDYMDNVGTDERLEESFISLGDVSNPDLKDLLTDIFSFQQQNILRRVTTFDVYAFIWSGNDTTAWNTINRILNCFLDANYRSYQILNEKGIRDLVKTCFNLNDFSVVEASSHAFADDASSIKIVPISLTDVDGSVTVYNKTTEEKIRERKARQAEEEAQKRELERRKREKKNRRKKSEKGSNKG